MTSHMIIGLIGALLFFILDLIMLWCFWHSPRGEDSRIMFGLFMLGLSLAMGMSLMGAAS